MGGDYIVMVIVTDVNGDTAEASTTLSVESDTMPVVSMTLSELVQSDCSQNQNMLFECTATGGNAPLSYRWDFGDGAGAQNPTSSNFYESPGVYRVTCTVTDRDGDVVTSIPIMLTVMNWCGCVTPNAPEVVAKPRSVTGLPVTFLFEAPDSCINPRFECRTGPLARIGCQEWVPCDADYTVDFGTQEPDDGFYQTEVRASCCNAATLSCCDVTGDAAKWKYYLHKSLNDVTPCPEPTVTREAIFEKASQYLDLFHSPAFGSGTQLHSPFIKLDGIVQSAQVLEDPNDMSVACQKYGYCRDANPRRVFLTDLAGWMADGVLRTILDYNDDSSETNGKFEPATHDEMSLLSLRKEFELSADRKLLLIERVYPFRSQLKELMNDQYRVAGHECAVGLMHIKPCENSEWTPLDATKDGFIYRTKHCAGPSNGSTVLCDFIVMNAKGESVCLGLDNQKLVLRNIMLRKVDPFFAHDNKQKIRSLFSRKTDDLTVYANDLQTPLGSDFPMLYLPGREMLGPDGAPLENLDLLRENGQTDLELCNALEGAACRSDPTYGGKWFFTPAPICEDGVCTPQPEVDCGYDDSDLCELHECALPSGCKIVPMTSGEEFVPMPSFAEPPAAVVGYPALFSLNPVPMKGASLQCRCGPVAAIENDAIPFTECASGEYECPLSDEGRYLLEVRVADYGCQVSERLIHYFYFHHSLDGVERCSSTGVTDSEFLAEARRYLVTDVEFGPDTRIDRPFITLQMTQADHPRRVNVASGAANEYWSGHRTLDFRMGYPKEVGQKYFTRILPELKILSLRKDFVLTGNTLLLIRREYPARIAPDVNGCQLPDYYSPCNSVYVGNWPGTEQTEVDGQTFNFRPIHCEPEGTYRALCDVIVMNARGNAVCLEAVNGYPSLVRMDPFFGQATQRKILRAFSRKTTDLAVYQSYENDDWWDRFLYLPDAERNPSFESAWTQCITATSCSVADIP